MEMKLISKRHHQKSIEGDVTEWWILIFADGDDKLQKRIEKDDYMEIDWIDGAIYECSSIQPTDILESSIPHGRQMKLDAVIQKKK